MQNIQGRFLVGALLPVLLGAAPAAAGLIYDTNDLMPFPDLFSSLITSSYDAGTDSFTASGLALSFDGGSGYETISGGSFSIDAMIDDTGAGVLGSLAIEGNVSGLGTLLLSGTLIDFGWGESLPGEGPFQFLFAVTGGDLAAFYGDEIAVTMTQNLGFGGDWTQSFAGSFSVADTQAMALPGPAVVALLALAGVAHDDVAENRGRTFVSR